jgi:hypothetical protein
MPKPWLEIDDKPPRFDIKKFFADVISFEQGEQDYTD